jgi:hypothetical protein
MLWWFGQEIVQVQKVWMGAKAQRMQFVEACTAWKMTTVLAPDLRIGLFLWMQEVLQLLTHPGHFKRAESTWNTILLFLEVLLEEHHPERMWQSFGWGWP